MVFNRRHRHDIELDEQSARIRWRALNPPRQMACYPLPGRSALQIHSPADPDLVQIEQMEIFFKIFIDGQRAIHDYKQKEKLSGKQSSDKTESLTGDTGPAQEYVFAAAAQHQSAGDVAGSDRQGSGGSEGGCGEAEGPDGDQGSDGGEGGKD